MSDPVARLNATLEGRYAIERELGEGTTASAEAQTDGTASPERFIVVTNWFEELRQRMGSN